MEVLLMLCCILIFQNYFYLQQPEMLEKFEINADTGVITTKVEFDR